MCAIITKDKKAKGFGYFFPYTDHLGSILTVTNGDGDIIAEQNFDAWGRRRNPNSWDYNNVNNWGVNNTETNPIWLYRGYTGHEHLPEFGLINMNARLYDPVLGRMLSPDNYVGEGGTQGFNRYSYAGNNPLKFTDPSGNFLVEAVIIGAVVGGGINAAIQGITGNINSEKDFWKAFGQGALQGAMIGAGAGAINPAFYGQIVTGIASSYLPSYQFEAMGLTVGISPALVFGSNGFGIGANFSVGMPIGNNTTLSIGIGSTYYSGHGITGKSGFESRFTGAASYDDGKFGITFGSSNYSGLGIPSQTLGYFKARRGDWSVSYENDGTPFQYVGLGDGFDSYRTAAIGVGYQDLEINMRLFTGKREYGNQCYDKNDFYGSQGYVGNPDINDYRAGILTLGYKGYSAGINDDRVRQAFQNKLAHEWLQPQPKIPNLPLSKPFFEYRTKNPFTHW